MSTPKSLLVGILIVAQAACSVTVLQHQFATASQALDAPVPSGSVRIVFFNASNELRSGVVGMGPINVLVNNRGVGTLESRRYVQVDLAPGTKNVTLVRRDLGEISSTHGVKAESSVTYVEVFSRPMSIDIRVVQTLPEDFVQRYSAALEES